MEDGGGGGGGKADDRHGAHAAGADKRREGLVPDGSGADGDAEKAHFEDVCRSFEEYWVWALHDVARQERAVSMLSERHRRLLPKGALDAKLLAQRRAIDVNQTFLHAVVAVHAGGGGDGHAAGRVPLGGPVDLSTLPRLTASPHQFSKVASTLHQLVRDWSEEGAPERELCYTPLLDELVVRLPVTPSNKNKQRVLVPGSGLGRLAFEIACRGYVTQGNEFAYHMLLTGSVCLNSLGGPRSVAVHPWIDQPCNHISTDDMLRPVAIPDVNTRTMMAAMNPDADMSMIAGDFVEIYGKQEAEWDCVVTCFFLDTAANPIEYIEIIYQILKPGGMWINLGPLLYHWASAQAGDTDERYARSIELSYAEIRHVMLGVGFKFLREGTQRCQYASNMRSLMRTVYNGILFTAVKPLEPDSRAPADSLDAEMDSSTRAAVAAALAQVASADSNVSGSGGVSSGGVADGVDGAADRRSVTVDDHSMNPGGT